MKKNSRRLKMAETKGIRPVCLRLSNETHEALRDAVTRSAHRSMSALADEILSEGLARRNAETMNDLDRMIRAARDGGA
jgi:hypothetical protein